MTQIVMKLATSPSEMSGLTLGSRLLDSPVLAHTYARETKILIGMFDIPYIS